MSRDAEYREQPVPEDWGAPTPPRGANQAPLEMRKSRKLRTNNSRGCLRSPAEPGSGLRSLLEGGEGVEGG